MSSKLTAPTIFNTKHGDRDMNLPPERRKYKRIEKHFILTYYDQNDPMVRFDASQLKNISLGGMCLITSKSFAPFTVLNIELKTPFQSELTHLEGIVIQSQEKISGIIYETHLEFQNITDSAKRILAKIIEHFDKEEEEHHE